MIDLEFFQGDGQRGAANTASCAISSFSNPVRMNHAYNLLNLHR
ncbi:hypothetical protein [Bordetella pertussis]